MKNLNLKIGHFFDELEVIEMELLLNKIIEIDEELLEHSERMLYYSLILFNEIKEAYNFSEQDKKKLFWSALLHDIGKMHIDKCILNKPEKLKPCEFKKIRKHPTYAVKILSKYTFLEESIHYILCHHEKVDGSGYPAELASDEIPIISKIISIADAFDAMTTDRPYRQKLPVDVALNELLKCSESQFDGFLVDKFVDAYYNGRIELGWRLRLKGNTFN